MARRNRATAVRATLTVALIGYAGLALGNGLDRLTAQAPPLERLVPRPFRAEAERAAARQAAVRDQPQAFLAHARAAVAADPVDPGSASLLGGALLLRGDNRGAEQAFRVSARFGWRDIPTQAYWYEAALEAREMEPAVDRLDALLRAQPQLPSVDLLLGRLEASTAGRAVLERRLAQRPPWLANYLEVGGKDAPLIERRASVLMDMARQGTRLGCHSVGGFVGAALAAGARRAAEQVWLAHCPGAHAAAGIADPAFEQVGNAQTSPFGWQTLPAGDVAIEAAGPGQGGRLQVSNGSSVSRLVLMQPVALEPGRYRVSIMTVPGRVGVSLGCNGVPPLPSRDAGDVAASGQVVEVPACARQAFGVWLRPGAEAVELGRLSLQRIG